VASWAAVSDPRTDQRHGSRRRKIFALAGAVVAVVVVLVAVLVIFFRDGNDSNGDDDAAFGPTIVQVDPGNVVSETAGPAATFPEDQRDVIVKKVRDYVEKATVEPLRSGKAAKGLDQIFDAAAITALQGPDGDVMLDQGLPQVIGKLKAVSQPIAINALADNAGAWVMVSASLDLDVKGGLDDGTLQIVRTGELLFVPDAGEWKVTAFDVAVERKGPGTRGNQGKKGQSQ
jgi:hypothetical protein